MANPPTDFDGAETSSRPAGAANLCEDEAPRFTDNLSGAASIETALISLSDGSAGYGDRILWSHLNLAIQRGEFIAVLGPNGAGKTSLLKVLLQQLPLKQGQLHRAPGVRLGYVPQLKDFHPHLPLRGKDLVGLGLDGSVWGLRPGPCPGKPGQPNEHPASSSPFHAYRQHRMSRSERAEIISHALDEVQALPFANAPLHMLSGGEQQRLRIAQSLVTNPDLLLLDEPLLSLDIANQQVISRALEHRLRLHGTSTLLVTHEINPILPLVDRIVYIARGRALIGPVNEVMTSHALSELYAAPVSVVREHGQIVVIAGSLPDDNEDEPAGLGGNTWVPPLSPALAPTSTSTPTSANKTTDGVDLPENAHLDHPGKELNSND